MNITTITERTPMLFACFAMAWTVCVAAFVIALLLGYQLPIGEPREHRRQQSLTLLDSTSIDL